MYVHSCRFKINMYVPEVVGSRLICIVVQLWDILICTHTCISRQIYVQLWVDGNVCVQLWIDWCMGAVDGSRLICTVCAVVGQIDMYVCSCGQMGMCVFVCVVVGSRLICICVQLWAGLICMYVCSFGLQFNIYCVYVLLCVD